MAPKPTYEELEHRIRVLERESTEGRRAVDDLQEGERKFWPAAEQLLDVIYLTDDQGVIKYISPASEAFFGYKPKEMEGRHFKDFLEESSWTSATAAFTAAMEKGVPAESLELRMVRKNRSSFTGELRGRLFKVGSRSCAVGVIRDITERKQAEERIRVLTQELMKAHEVERQMMSLELHDRVAQDLSTVKIGLESLLYALPEASPEIRKQGSDLCTILQNSITAVRDLAYDLRPPSLDQLGLVQSVHQYCEEFSEKAGIAVDFSCAGIDQLNLDADTEINLYRLVQEGLINVRKHAEAAHVGVRMVASFPDLILRIMDDGKGFDVEERRRSLTRERRMGLRSMEERVRWLGGTMNVKSSPGKGTRIAIHIPHKESPGGAEEDPADRG